MAYYRLYFFDGAGGHITGVAEFEAHSDPAAIAAAEATRGIAPMELWCAERPVRRWAALPAAAVRRGRNGPAASSLSA
ncbi:MAG TPA: hypothetical protein VNH53_09710 [Sphingomicrobium sp.]|nr:hypothetical protein [Sphingomicrobium sp.]